MDAKLLLKGYVPMMIRYKDLKQQLSELENKVYLQTYNTQTKVQTTKEPDKIGNIVALKEGMELTLSKTITDLETRMNFIITAIEHAEDELAKTILTKKYIQGKDSKTICNEMRQAKTWMYQIQSIGITNIQIWLDENEKNLTVERRC